MTLPGRHPLLHETVNDDCKNNTDNARNRNLYRKTKGDYQNTQIKYDRLFNSKGLSIGKPTADEPSASIPIKPPSTSPARISKNKAQEFLLPAPLIYTPPRIVFLKNSIYFNTFQK